MAVVVAIKTEDFFIEYLSSWADSAAKCRLCGAFPGEGGPVTRFPRADERGNLLFGAD